MKILIPTYKDEFAIKDYVEKVASFSPGCEIFASCQDGSASVNRNWCLEKSGIQVGEVGIMIDDDIAGFYDGWVDDLCFPFREDFPVKNIAAVSARLMRPDGRLGETCTRCFDLTPNEIVVKSKGTCTIPTAAISFQYRGIKFDENFIGSGFEDNDFWLQYIECDPDCKFIQSNRARLCHLNFMTNQKGKFWDHNCSYFRKKWNVQ